MEDGIVIGGGAAAGALDGLAVGAGTAAEGAREVVLVVDDNQVNRRLLAGILERQGYEVREAADGETGLRLAREERLDLILLDVMMPGMNGYDTCRALKRSDATRHVPVIFLSALSEAKDRVLGLEAGGADYVTKPFDRFEVLARVRTQVDIHRLNCGLRETNRELRRKQAALDADLEAAATIQRTLLPARDLRFGPASLAWRFVPSARVSGDFFNVFRLERDLLALQVVDVSGHGVPAAMVTVCLSQTLSPSSGKLVARDGKRRRALSPCEVLRMLDEEYPLERFGKHFTIAYLLLNLRSGELCYGCAGHPPPVIVRQGTTAEPLPARGPVIGMGMPHAFEQGTTVLARGDRLFLYTDGIPECTRSEGDYFGETRLYEKLRLGHRGSLEDACGGVMEELSSFRGDAPPEDDISLVGLELAGADTPRERLQSSA